MLDFQRVFYKNFLSSGDRGIEIVLNKHSSTLITGENGAGKSTILDAITFALYGKGFRNITKSQLVNSINDKACHVEIEFKAGGKHYKIIRGIKPNKFDIICDGTLVNQDASSRDYQKYLENNILKMNEKSFRQIVILGSADYVPFMQLKAQDRRSIIEDLLDINVFSDMNKILKEKIDVLKNDVTDAVYKVGIAQQAYDSFLQFQKEDADRTQKQIEVIESDIKEHTDAIGKNSKEIENLKRQIEGVSYDKTSHTTCSNQITNIKKLLTQAEVKKQSHTKLKTFFDVNDSCATCRQGITHEHKTAMICEAVDEIQKIEEAETKLNKLLASETNKLQDFENNALIIRNLENEISRFEETNRMLNAFVTKSEANKQVIVNESKNRNVPHKNKVESDLTSAQNLLNGVKKDQEYHMMAANMLKDDGIKTRIIRQYLPVINKLINGYLVTLGLSVDFNLNEQFEETIKSRYRDEFSYSSFSEGEKARIDLSIMLTWRAIAKMKNSASTNLLVLDETFDGSLDGNATEELLGILSSLEKTTNIFVISHRNDSLYDKFKNLIEFEKVNSFSQMKGKNDGDE